jgi:IS30 family transposase
VVAGLGRCWSPQQISARLRADYPDDVEMRISHETIYKWTSPGSMDTRG